MMRDASQFKTYNYGDALYWDERYTEEGDASFDWYQRYSALRPFLLKFVPTSSRILNVGCGNAAISEDMLKDGYVEIMNIDISSIVIEIMQRRCSHISQLKYMQMDVRDMSFFQDEAFDCVLDKGTLDSLMCGTDAPLSAYQMLEEVSRILKPGGIYMLITYGDPSVRVPHLQKAGCFWNITLYIISRPGFIGREGTTLKSTAEPVPLMENGLLPRGYALEDPDSHFIYICKKTGEPVENILDQPQPYTNSTLNLT